MCAEDRAEFPALPPSCVDLRTVWGVPDRRYDDGLLSLIEPYVYESVSRHNGSISAEHGIGVMKAQCLSYSKSPVAVELMWRIKDAVDPQGIMNPYKVLPPRGAGVRPGGAP